MPAEFDDFDQFPADAAWLQQESETDTAYAAFSVYRDQDRKRSLRLACQEFYRLDALPERSGETAGKLSQIEQWSAKYGWVERAAAYTRHLDRLARIEKVQAVKDMNERHAAVANLALAKAAEKLRGIDATTMTTRDATALLDTAAKLERLARGGATEILGTDDPDAMIDAQLKPVFDNPELAMAAHQIAIAIEEARTGGEE